MLKRRYVAPSALFVAPSGSFSAGCPAIGTFARGFRPKASLSPQSLKREAVFRGPAKAMLLLNFGTVFGQVKLHRCERFG